MYEHIVAKAVFVFEDDPEEQQAMVIAHDNALWIVLSWLQNAKGTRFPEQIAPLEKFPHRFELPAGPFRLLEPISRVLFDASPPKATAVQYGLRLHPDAVHIQGPGGIQ